jgi:hypothetical protein
MISTEKEIISYSAVVLDDRSRERLINKFKTLIPEGWDVIADHMTINMGEILPHLEKFLGLNVSLIVTEYAINDMVLAVGVTGFEVKDKKPHITIAANTKDGGKPKMSNDLTDWKPISTLLRLTGKVAEVPFKF